MNTTSPTKSRNAQWHSLLAILVLLLLSGIVKAQNTTELRKSESAQSTNFHIKVSETSTISIANTSQFILNYFELPKENRFDPRKRLTDAIGLVHIRFTHYLGEHEILGSDVVGHYLNGVLQSFNGVLYLVEEQALNYALQYIGANSYKWEKPGEEAIYKLWKDDSLATYFPDGQLIYAPKDLNFDNALVLCYRFEINSEDPLLRKDVYVNATSGEIWGEEDLLHIADVKGSANTKYRGVKAITTDSVSATSFRLRETGRGGGIETYNMKKGTNYGAAVDFTDADNYWNNYNSNFDEIAGDAHFGAEKTFDYFLEKFKRNSFDGNGAKIRSYVHYRSNYANAFWNGSVMTYGDGNGTSFTPLTSIDICGHEVSHAVTTNSARLVYSYESGALNESFSDIFGNAIEYYADSTQFSWRMGEDIMASANGIRNMADPKTHKDPSTYKGQYWHTKSSDNGGVHTNSGVQNYWFYLLCTGKSGKNDNNDSYVVDSIGITKAEQIAYRNLTVYLTRTSKYADARYYAIQSAVDLYGYCSQEVEATTNAWYAVGVGAEYDSSYVAANFEADTAYCQNSERVQFVNLSSNAKSFEWSFGDGQTSTTQNPLHTYTQQKYYTVRLIAEGCYKGLKDTITKVNYILFDSTRDICNGYLMPYRSSAKITICEGFIYDHGGLDKYTGLTRDTLIIDFSISDSAHLTFEEFDYEKGYDSVYVYMGYDTKGILLGGFTGQTLPNNGKPFTSYNGGFTITHFSDPLAVGTGFKARFQAFRPALKLLRTPDTTVCYKQKITLNAFGSGGSAPDREYYWNGVRGGQNITLVVTKDTLVHIRYRDGCMKEEIRDSIQITVRDSVTFTQSNDSTICQGTDIDLVVKPNGGLNSYWFSYSTGGVSSQMAESRTTQSSLQPGLHRFWIAMSDRCTETFDTAFFQIQVRDSLQVSTSSDTTICRGTSATISTNSTGGLSPNLTYFWGATKTTNSSNTVAPLRDTMYWVRISDNCSVFEPQSSVQIFVLDSLSIGILGRDTACYGESITLTSTASGGDLAGHSYNWNNGESNLASYTVVVRSDTVIALMLSDGCTPKSAVKYHSIVVLDRLQIIQTPNTSICLGQSIDISIQSIGGIPSNHILTWDNSQGTGFNKTLTTLTTTTYSLTLSDNCSDQGQSSFTVVVNPLPQTEFSLAENPSCTGIDIVFTNETKATASDQYTWNFGNGVTSNLRDPIYAYNQPGTYTIKLVSVNEFGCTDSIIKLNELQIVEHPTADFTYTPLLPDFLNMTIDFVNQSTQSTTYRWDFGNGSISPQNNPSHTYQDSGRYLVTLTAENGLGCSDDISKWLVIKDAFVLYIPNAVSPNKDEINEEFNIVVRGMETFNIQVFNGWGEVVYSANETNKGWDASANGKTALIGTYFYLFTGFDLNGIEVIRSGPIYVIR